MNKDNRRLGMPVPDGVSIPGQSVPEWVKKIKPNYPRIRRLYLLFCLAAAIMVFIMEWAMFIVFSKNPAAYGGFKSSIPAYLLYYNILPSALNFGAVGFAAWLHKHGKHELIQNFAPVIAMVIICTTTACAHTIYSATVAVLCLPIVMASVYGIKIMNYLTSAVCLIGLTIATVFRSHSPYLVNDLAFWPETAIAYLLVISVSAISLVMIMLLDTQKKHLIKTAGEAFYASQQAREASEAKSAFLANMSHEIRTPLNVIIGLTEMISRKAGDDEILEYAGDIQQASNSLLAIINDVLDISKIESGRLEIKETTYELGSLINDSYSMVAARRREKGLSALVECDPELPRLLYGDEYHLRQIIVNLLTNAVKYTRKGGIELRVSGEEGGGVLRLEVKVSDTGIGIREEDMPKLFEKFNRLDMTRNRQVEGTGLGLSITKQLVELMNGTIEVQSVYGEGSTFTVRVPQKVADPTPIGDIHTTYLNMHGDIESYNKSFEAPEARILVVDDIAINLQVIERLLEETGVQVDTALSGRECLFKICNNEYDLILLDHMMPELDGVETLKAMKELDETKNRDVPVIMLTANAMLGAREEYINAGFTDYLSKPVRGAKLEWMLMKYLPKEKVKVVYDAKPAASEPVSFLEKLRRSLPEIDISSGIAYCADDEEFYRTMLRDFAKSGRDASLEVLFAEKNWPAYQIEAHTLKSSARMVGLNLLSDESCELETAAKNGDEKLINEKHSGVTEHFAAVAEAIKKII